MPEEATKQEKEQLLRTIAALNEKLTTVQTISERMEAMERQVADAKKIWEQPQPFKQAVAHEQTGDFNDVLWMVKNKGVAGLQQALLMPIKEGASEKTHLLKQLWDNFWLTHHLLSGVSQFTGKRYILQETNAYKQWDSYLEHTAIKDAMSTTGAGADLVPTMWSSEMQEYYRLGSNVLPLFEEITMPSESYVYPLQTGVVQIYNAGQSTTTNPAAIESSTITTAPITFNAQKPAGRLLWSGELNEDTLIPILPIMRKEFPAAAADAWEDAIINGVKVGTTHIDTGDTYANDHIRRMCHGLRYHAHAQSATYDCTTGTTTYAYTDHGKAKVKMGKYAGLKAPLTEFAWLLSSIAYLLAADFDELTKVQNVTAQYATILRGTVNFIGGSPVILTDKIRTDLNGSDIYDGITKDYTSAIGVFRPGFKKGTRRIQTLEVTRIARTDQYEIVAMERGDFQAMFTGLASGQSLACVVMKIS